jgi:serine/threonine protein kinase
MTLREGSAVGPYEIRDRVGVGGMGEVYRAIDSRLNRTVAIKVIPAAAAGDPARRERFRREARTISSLNHPHICTIYDVGRHEGADYIVMEYLEGETLAARLGRCRDNQLPLKEALRYAIEIADARDQAHRHGVVHRDVKPANIMLTAGGAKLLDFGLATAGLTGLVPTASGDPSPLTDDPASLTAEGTLVGTLAYMAPEQLEGKEADPASDLFAFGAVLFEMISGLSKRRYIPPYAFATVYVGLGMKDSAFKQLQRGCLEHSAYLDYLNVEPHLDPLRADPRFADLVRCVRLSVDVSPVRVAVRGHPAS